MQVERSDRGLQSSDLGWYNTNMNDVSDLIIYQRALKLLEPIYRLAKMLPKDESRLRSQICNSAKAISAQIAEGFAKKDSQVEFKRFLLMALGSSDETITHLRQIELLGFPMIKKETCVALIDNYKIESKQINSLIQKIKKKSEI